VRIFSDRNPSRTSSQTRECGRTTEADGTVIIPLSDFSVTSPDRTIMFADMAGKATFAVPCYYLLILQAHLASSSTTQ
jgi:hypothetical protein